MSGTGKFDVKSSNLCERERVVGRACWEGFMGTFFFAASKVRLIMVGGTVLSLFGVSEIWAK